MSLDLRGAIRAAYREAFGAEGPSVHWTDGVISIGTDRYVRLEPEGKRWRAFVGVKDGGVWAIEDTAPDALQQAVRRWKS